MKNLKLNPKMNIEKRSIPDTSLYVYIVDDFLLDTSPIINFAHNIAYFHPMFSDNSYYPGMRDNMPQPYLDLLQDFFQKEITPQLIKDTDHISKVHKCLLSLIACEPEKLLLEQKIPHIDSCNEMDFAFVHYLSAEEHGGTNFYKYVPNNIIQFNEQDRYILDEMMDKVKANQGEHKSYISSSTSIFEQVLSIKAKFNRLIVYQGNVLHSASVGSDKSYSRNPKKGRLSIASFASVFRD